MDTLDTSKNWLNAWVRWKVLDDQCRKPQDTSMVHTMNTHLSPINSHTVHGRGPFLCLKGCKGVDITPKHLLLLQGKAGLWMPPILWKVVSTTRWILHSNGMRTPLTSKSKFSFRSFLAKILSRYYRVIHATHPLLPDSKAQLHLHLAKASGPIREAFLAAIETLVKPASLTPASDPQNVQLSSKAVGLLMTLQFEDHKNRSFIDNLVYLQSTLLMVLTIDMNISTSFQPPVWYSLAYSMSNFLGLRARPSYKHNTDPEINELEKLARRAWILLMTLDRWYAASTLNPVLTPPKGLTLLQQDSALLGDVGYHLARKQ